MSFKAFTDHIISGSLKGRKILLPDDGEVRPTKNRVRQAVFNMLGSRLDWDGLRVVDLCCGSGAWGLEALSRGAGEVYLMDKDVKAVGANVAALGLKEAVQVVKGSVLEWVPPSLVNVVLADPPYTSGLAQKVVLRAAELGLSGAWWCVETQANIELKWDGFEEVEHRDYGNSRIWLARQV